MPCHAQWLDVVEDVAKAAAKAGKAGGAAAKGAARAVKALGKAEVLVLASGLGAGVVYIEVRDTDILLDALNGVARSVAKGTDDMSDAVRSFTRSIHKPKFVVTRESVAGLGGRLDSLTEQGTVYVVDPVYGPLRLIVRRTGASVTNFAELRPGLLVDLESALPAELAKAFAAPAKLEDIVVAPLLARADLDSFVRLAGAAGDRLAGAESLKRAVEAKSFAPFQGKTLVVVGHVENGQFVARGADGGIAYSVRIAEIERLAAEAEVSIIAAGCSSYWAGSKIGYVEAVTDQDVAASIARMFEAKTQGDMLAAFGAKTPLVVSPASLEQFTESRVLELEALDAYGRPIRDAGRVTRVVSSFRTEKAASDLAQAGMGWYIAGIVGFAAMFSRNRGAFLRAFPKLPTPELPAQRARYYPLLIASWLAFLLLSPAFTALVLLLSFLGGWSHRQQVLDFCWSFVRRPIAGAGTLLLVAVGTAVLLAVYGVLLLVLLFPGAALIGSALGGQLTSIVWLDALLCIAYVGFALWAGRWAHRRLLRFLDGATPASIPTPQQVNDQ